MQPLKITAELMTGFASKFDWSPSIDGILAWVVQRERLGVEEFTLTQHRSDLQEPVKGLPLAVEHYDDDWWYQCSQPIFESKGVVTHNLHRRFNVREAEKLSHDKKTKIETTKGPYKNARFQLKQHITPQIAWYAIGDKQEIERLLESITHIGAKVGAGFGRVRPNGWRVELSENLDTPRFFRPLPKSFADAHGISGIVMEWGHRPPLRIPENNRVCVIPYAR